jgi:hypothetical protein
MQRIGMNPIDTTSATPQGEWELHSESWWQHGLYPESVALPVVGINDSWISSALALQLPEQER